MPNASVCSHVWRAVFPVAFLIWWLAAAICFLVLVGQLRVHVLCLLSQHVYKERMDSF